MNRLATCLFIFLFAQHHVFAQDEFRSGLIGTYSASTDGSQDANWKEMNPTISFDWDSNLKAANWSGQILIRSVTPYRFYSQSAGNVAVRIDDEIVLESQTDQSRWSRGDEVKIAPGFRSIQVHYEPANEAAVLKLFWSSDEFEVEPIPAHLLFHEPENNHLELIELGEQLFDAHRCANCHREADSDAELFPAPALWGSTSGTNSEWIVEKLLGKHSHRMPNFGFDRKQAEDIAAYLHRLEAPFDLMTAPDAKRDKKAPDGKVLFHTLGCLACHQNDNVGQDDPYSGPPLTVIGNKRSKDWLATWLASPERINPQHRMPKFKLSRSERGLLANYLSSLGKQNKTTFGTPKPRPTSAQADRGRQLVKDFQCANCHKLPAIEASANPARSLRGGGLDWTNSCLSKNPDETKRRPAYDNMNFEAIRAYVENRLRSKGKRPTNYERGQLVMARRQCLACHSRGTNQGLKKIVNDIAQALPSLQGQTQVLIPPSLNAVGDKLLDSVLDEALSGKQQRVRANWLKVRMPEFQHDKEEIAALKHYFITHDRIPADGATEVPSVELDQDELLLTGRQLIGAGGFSCIACHQVGDYVPKNTALGTRGSDLTAIGKRLRPEFYHRWTRAPLRVVPGMEMPSYKKPVPGVLDDNVHQQLATVWNAVNDDRFEPPTNPTQVEQLWQVAEDSQPRIVRDVFTVSEDNGGGAVARAFAIGFSNQHGILFDLDQAAVREWQVGDFARQRTEGKSWYWDMAGANVALGFAAESDIVLVRKSDSSIVPLVAEDEDRLALPIGYRTDSESVEIQYNLKASLDGKSISIPVTETFRELNDSTNIGWQRSVSAEEIPEGYQLGVALERDLQLRLGGKIETASTSAKTIETTNLQVIHNSAENRNDPVVLNFVSTTKPKRLEYPERKSFPTSVETVTTLPGYIGTRLPIDASIMATAIAYDENQNLLVTSLKGHLYRVSDVDHDGIEERAEIIEEGLSAAFGVSTDGNDILVIHKPELLRLIDSDGDGSIDQREIVADGWGHTDNYHDWVTGPVKARDGGLLIATGSDYSQPDRDLKRAKWRGSVVRAGTDGTIERIANELRYPIGIAADARGRVFTSDQQGVQNTFNEINHIVPGASYGVPGRLDGEGSKSPKLPAIQVPHPWTRSVNGIFFLPEEFSGPFAGHGIGCEYNSKFLIRFTYHEVDGELQGACYPFTKSTWENEANTFLGPICGFASDKGDIYIGSIFDSGWLGGPNVGEVVKLSRSGDIPNGIREVRAVPEGIQVEFVSAVDPTKATDAENYSISGYTRVWQGSYATDDSGRYSPKILGVKMSDNDRVATLVIDDFRERFVYEINVADIGIDGEEIFPAFAAYTMNRVPKPAQ